MRDECLICGAPLKYLENDDLKEFAICHKKENSKTACEKGHNICNECHTQGMDVILGVKMELDDIKCSHSARNNQCIGKRCHFFGK